MADAFKEREKGYEAKFKMDADRRFKVDSRRNRLIGEWAASKLGLAGGAIGDYVKEVIRSDFEAPGLDDVVRKISADFAKNDVKISESDIRKEMDRLYGVAMEQVNKEFPASL